MWPDVVSHPGRLRPGAVGRRPDARCCARATVSGFHDRAAQIGVILGPDAVAEALRQAPVKSPEFEGTGADGGLRWEIESNDCEADLVPKASPAQGSGAVRYAIAEVGRCR
ncbi:MAG: hypothetical protein ACK4S2_07230 [Gemmobacter sp.]|uniref:hypothetical protein n=1 Tax=Gemmobacter sp. TaxID=1898957 RepID=UPI003918D822